MPKKTSKKKRINVGEKGRRWEREIAELLSLWMSRSHGDTRDDLLWRSAGSGSRATKAQKKGKLRSTQAGDLSATDERAAPLTQKFFIEAKAYANLKLEGLFWRKPGEPLKTLVDKPLMEARMHNKWPFLVFRQNNQTPLLVLPYSVAVIVTKLSGILPDVSFARQVGDHVEKMSSFFLPDFLEKVDYINFVAAVVSRHV